MKDGYLPLYHLFSNKNRNFIQPENQGTKLRFEEAQKHSIRLAFQPMHKKKKKTRKTKIT